LPDDNLSGTGLRIVEGTTLALPVVGTWLAFALFGGEFPGRVIEHLYVVHLLTPLVVVVLVALRLRLRLRAAWRSITLQSAGLFVVTAGVLTLMAGTLTVSPVWRYGPASPGDAYAGSQPDWYTAFLDGALRLVPPGWEVVLGGRTWTLAVLVPLGAIGLFFALLTLWPLLEERLTGDRADHLRVDRPRDAPLRTAVGVVGVTFYGTLWLAGSADVLATQLHVSFEAVIRVLRVVLLLGPPLAAAVAVTVCRTLRTAETERREHGEETGQVVQLPSGGFVELHGPPEPGPGDDLALVTSGSSERREL
jgi:ubiquinol-cytochrome c reductase cytochrome b subunit